MTPLYDQLLNYSKQQKLQFHTPGHRAGRSLGELWQSPVITDLDLTEISGLAWEQAREAAERLAAEFYKADRSFFLVQGASQGILAALLGCFRPGDKVLVARNCHISVFTALIVADLVPVYLEVNLLSDWGLPLEINPDHLQGQLLKHPDSKGLIVTNPTYQGVATNLAKYRELIGERILIVDEAHGGHFEWCGFSGFNAYRYADLWVHGTHKFLGSLTQTGILHLKTQRVDVERIRWALALITTTSPSFILMSSLDCNREYLEQEGHRLFLEKLPLVTEVMRAIAKLSGVRVLADSIPDRHLAIDPWRLVVSFLDSGLNGFLAENILVDEYQIQPEYADFNQVTFLVSPWQDKADYYRLIDAFSSLVARYQREAIQPIIIQPKLPQLVRSPRTAALGKVQPVKLDGAVGRIAATMVAPYPPGIPLLSPGESISAEEVALIDKLIVTGAKIIGLTGKNEIMVSCE
ncbi:MAG TPA: aminotransferase class I/II-fold pyridoxal phosphate-dependent enzyme [Bacillota bacterium]|jgi:arginine decarboxylase|nr:aminotransferase class I/II-fold pyridoxal phosphate-dependent enzyme [Bacillota bacterium]HOL08605.1 aminotransferase class I/II-fold pyridoxal phosphate-dependent enzyme [Bacillota bacterium]HPO98412.1 aminotransferase class I/II-fold pyridoxal phosphate-dependent enzyme [Bacillota bacterium]